MNGPLQNRNAFQNWVGEHWIAGAPASLHNLAKSVPDPSFFLKPENLKIPDNPILIPHMPRSDQNWLNYSKTK